MVWEWDISIFTRYPSMRKLQANPYGVSLKWYFIPVEQILQVANHSELNLFVEEDQNP